MMKAATALARIAANRKAIEFLYSQTAEQVEIARTNGVSWQKIGDALGITRSAAQQYYGR
jgi:predicted transcriptional regulator